MFSMQSLKRPCVHRTNSRLGKSSTLTKHKSVPAALLALNQPLSNSYADIYTYACIHTGSESRTLMHTQGAESCWGWNLMDLQGSSMSSLASLYKYRSTYVSNKILFVNKSALSAFSSCFGSFWTPETASLTVSNRTRPHLEASQSPNEEKKSKVPKAESV